MLYRRFGSAAVPVAVVGQGTWRIEKGDRLSAIRALQRGIDLGMTHIDTAERYAFGIVEEMVGEAIRGRRSEIFLVSKILPENASRSVVSISCENSLRRLGTDRLDCYLLHWRGEIPLQDTVSAFEKLKQEGKILSWGVSNFDVPDLEEIASIAGVDKISCNQILYHLEERGSEHTAIPWCREHGIAITAYSSFGHKGFPAAHSEGGRILGAIAKDHSATPRQIALSFLMRTQDIFLIPRSTNLLHTEQNAGSAELQLLDSEVERLEAVFPRGEYPVVLPSI